MKTFEEAYNQAEEWVKKLREIDERIKNGEFNFDKIPKNSKRYARRKWNGKKRMRELVYKSFPPDDYHDWDLHRLD